MMASVSMISLEVSGLLAKAIISAIEQLVLQVILRDRERHESTE
jgi:hypothetical protein